MTHRLLFVSAALLLAGCAPTNVLFSDAERIPHPERDIVSIIYDRYGDLYPSDRVHVPGRALRENRPRSEDEFALSSYFSDQHAAKSGAWQALLAEAPLVTPGADTSFALAWNDVQMQLRKRVIDHVDHLTRSGPGASRRTLVVLVHGFNNDKSEALAWYEEVRRVVRSRVPDAVFLDVFWDGLSATLPPGIWSSAQYNFPLVGLEFRRILNAIDPAIPLRVVTHSSGGPLIASTMGDASAPLTSNDGRYRRYRAMVSAPTSEYRPPNPPDYRVGMLVPAASSITFSKFGPMDDGPDRLIIGINTEDIAISKLFMPCTFLGSTCMSGSKSSFCSGVVPAFAHNPHTRLFVFDFSGSGNNERQGYFWDSHAVSVYLRRDDMARFLNVLFEDGAGEAGEGQAVCGPG